MLSSKHISPPSHPFPLRIQKEISSGFHAAQEVRGLSGKLMTSLDLVPVCEDVQV